MEEEKRMVKRMLIAIIELLSMLTIFGFVLVIMIKKQIIVMTAETVDLTPAYIMAILISLLFVFIDIIINYILSRPRKRSK